MAIAATALLPLSQALNGGLPYIPARPFAAILGISALLALLALALPTRRALRARPVEAIGTRVDQDFWTAPDRRTLILEGSRRSPALLPQRPRGGSCDTMSSGAFAPVGAKAGLTHDAGRTSFSPDPLSAACLNACRLEFALDRRDRDRQRQARTRGSSPDARHRPDEQHFGVPPPTQVGARNRRLV